MTSREIWEREYKPLLFPFDRQRLGDIQAVRDNLARRPRAGQVGALRQHPDLEEHAASMGDYVMYMSLSRIRPGSNDFCRTYTDFYKQCYTILFAEAGKPTGCGSTRISGYKERVCLQSRRPGIADLSRTSRDIVDFFNSYDPSHHSAFLRLPGACPPARSYKPGSTACTPWRSRRATTSSGSRSATATA